MSDALPDLIAQVLPAGTEQRFRAGRPVTIGRDTACDLRVNGTGASRHHAIATPEPGTGWVLMDRSTNGTFVDGQRVGRHVIAGPLVVSIGDSAGGTQIRFAPAQAVKPVPGRLQRAALPGLGQFSRAYDADATRIRIGRAPDNDLVIDDLLVSRYHAELRRRPDGRSQIADLGSHNGTYLDGRQLTGRAEVTDGAMISIGHHAFVLSGGSLQEFIDSGAASFAAIDLSVRAGTRYLLKDLSFTADGGDFVTVLGPTGAGKSTLIKALSGYRPADTGSVLYNGRDIYANYQELRNRIGYVPQDDVLHPQLTVRSALRYAARLRFPPDATGSQRHARVDEVIAELGLQGCADLRLAMVSGGQRKRTSIALELLTKPSLLILDEPTSGLDPWYEWTVMELLRGLADGGRTVVAVTHTVESLDLCNRLLFLAPGGQTAYFGPPAESLPYFGVQRPKEIFNQLNHAPAGELAARFAGSQPDARYVQAPLAAARAGNGGSEGPSAPAASPSSPGWINQLAALTSRFGRVVSADRRNTAMLLLQAPILGILMAAILPTGTLAPGGQNARAAAQVITALVLSATYLGASNSIREIVKERAILTRERAVGLSPHAYVLSKALLLGVITMIQAALLVVIGVARQHGPGAGSVLGSGRVELFVVASATGLAAMALGLLISALVSNADKALTILPVLLFAEFLLTGGLFPVTAPGLRELSYLSSAHWGYAAAASTVNLQGLLGGCGGPGAAAALGSVCTGANAHTAGAWTGDMALLLVLGGVALIGAIAAVRRIGQPRRQKAAAK